MKSLFNEYSFISRINWILLYFSIMKLILFEESSSNHESSYRLVSGDDEIETTKTVQYLYSCLFEDRYVNVVKIWCTKYSLSFPHINATFAYDHFDYSDDNKEAIMSQIDTILKNQELLRMICMPRPSQSVSTLCLKGCSFQIFSLVQYEDQCPKVIPGERIIREINRNLIPEVNILCTRTIHDCDKIKVSDLMNIHNATTLDEFNHLADALGPNTDVYLDEFLKNVVRYSTNSSDKVSITVLYDLYCKYQTQVGFPSIPLKDFSPMVETALHQTKKRITDGYVICGFALQPNQFSKNILEGELSSWNYLRDNYPDQHLILKHLWENTLAWDPDDYVSDLLEKTIPMMGLTGRMHTFQDICANIVKLHVKPTKKADESPNIRKCIADMMKNYNGLSRIQ